MTDIQAPTVETQYGRVRGAVKDGISVFKGIPYGAPTSGGNRFRQPQPPEAWTGIRDALTYPHMAPQPDNVIRGLFESWTDPTTSNEDCLGLNIWTPGARDGGKRPVMVWFHGGDFSSLSGSRSVFDGTRLARRGDVVVVTVNHRLNAFGFLYLGELLPEFADSANAGMLDLVQALEWVRDNIAEFGGDPSNVTIFGQSGGGGKVATMMAMPAGQGLFHRAIIQSGTYARNAHLEAMTTDVAIRARMPVSCAIGGHGRPGAHTPSAGGSTRSHECPDYEKPVDHQAKPELSSIVDARSFARAGELRMASYQPGAGCAGASVRRGVRVRRCVSTHPPPHGRTPHHGQHP